jgi:hypothetical protein
MAAATIHQRGAFSESGVDRLSLRAGLAARARLLLGSSLSLALVALGAFPSPFSLETSPRLSQRQESRVVVEAM